MCGQWRLQACGPTIVQATIGEAVVNQAIVNAAHTRGLTCRIERIRAVAIFRKIVEIIAANLPDPTEIIWDTSKPAGDAMRIMDTTRAESHDIRTEISLEDGIRETMDWYRENQSVAADRYNAFTDPAHDPGRGK